MNDLPMVTASVRTQDGLTVHFSDGKRGVFSNELLYRMLDSPEIADNASADEIESELERSA
jgi:hypothetical protein